MGDKLMADVDVSNHLERIEKRIDKQDEVLISVNNSLTELVRIGERQISLAEKVESLSSRLDKMDDRITNNHDQIIKWSGGIAALICVVAIIGTLITIFGSISSTSHAAQNERNGAHVEDLQNHQTIPNKLS